MSTSAVDPRSTTAAPPRSTPEEESLRGVGSAWFVGVLLMIVGFLNFFYGIAALANSSFYAAGERYVFGDLHTWGWITIILGVIQFTAAFSLFAGNMYGRVIGIVAATVGAIESLSNVGGAHPWWSLGVFAVCLWVIHGLFVLGKPEKA
jgi:hypothetical protein